RQAVPANSARPLGPGQAARRRRAEVDRGLGHLVGPGERLLLLPEHGRVGLEELSSRVLDQAAGLQVGGPHRRVLVLKLGIRDRRAVPAWRLFLPVLRQVAEDRAEVGFGRDGRRWGRWRRPSRGGGPPRPGGGRLRCGGGPVGRFRGGRGRRVLPWVRGRLRRPRGLRLPAAGGVGVEAPRAGTPVDRGATARLCVAPACLGPGLALEPPGPPVDRGATARLCLATGFLGSGLALEPPRPPRVVAGAYPRLWLPPVGPVRQA